MLGLKVKFESGIDVHCCGICVCDLLQDRSPLFLFLFHPRDATEELKEGGRFVFLFF